MRRAPAIGWLARDFLWRHPEWWSIGIGALAWVTLVVSGLASPVTAPAPPNVRAANAGSLSARALVSGIGDQPLLAGHAGHPGHGHTLEGSSPGLASTIARSLGRWMLMIVAMMVPLLIGPIRTTATRSLWRRRHRAIAAFVAGYLLPWLAAGFLLAVCELAAPVTTMRSPALLAVTVVVAAGWQLTPVKRRALVSCHATRPLAPRGWQAWRDCVRFGWMVGTRCLVTCGPLMLVCVLAGHSLAAMAGVSVLGIAERSVKPANGAVTGSLLLAGGVAYLFAAR